MDNTTEKGIWGCLAIVLFFVLSIVVSISVGVFFGAGFGLLAFALFVAFVLVGVLRCFKKADGK